MMRLRLQMLAPVSAKCSWKRRMSSSVAVSGERLRNAANRLQLLMWPLCVPAHSLRAEHHALPRQVDLRQVRRAQSLSARCAVARQAKITNCGRCLMRQDAARFGEKSNPGHPGGREDG